MQQWSELHGTLQVAFAVVGFRIATEVQYGEGNKHIYTVVIREQRIPPRQLILGRFPDDNTLR